MPPTPVRSPAPAPAYDPSADLKSALALCSANYDGALGADYETSELCARAHRRVAAAEDSARTALAAARRAHDAADAAPNVLRAGDDGYSPARRAYVCADAAAAAAAHVLAARAALAKLIAAEGGIPSRYAGALYDTVCSAADRAERAAETASRLARRA